MRKGNYVLGILLSGVFLFGTEVVTAKENTSEEKMLHYQITEKTFDETTASQILFHDMEVEKEKMKNGSIIVQSGERVLWLTNGDISYKQNENASTEELLIFQYLNSEMFEDYWTDEKIEENEAVYYKISDLCELAEDEELRLVRAGKFNRQLLEQMQLKLKEYGQDLGIEIWNAEEYTALEYELYKDGIPLMGLNEPKQGYYLELFGVDPVYVRALVGDGEILCLTVQGLFEIQDSDRAELITREEALQIAEKEREEISSDSIWEMKEIRLEYVPIPDWTDTMLEPKELVPYWCVIGIKSNGEETYEEAVRINAVTGGNLAYGE